MLEMYNDADDLMHLVEAPDFEGNDIFWYLDEYSLFDILDCRIMDKVIQKKWIGPYTLNSVFLDTSVSYTLLTDKFGIFATDRVFSEINLKMFNFDTRHRIHRYKFYPWMNSMFLRSQIELVIVFLLTAVFQNYLVDYQRSLSNARNYFFCYQLYIDDNNNLVDEGTKAHIRSKYSTID